MCKANNNTRRNAFFNCLFTQKSSSRRLNGFPCSSTLLTSVIIKVVTSNESGLLNQADNLFTNNIMPMNKSLALIG